MAQICSKTGLLQVRLLIWKNPDPSQAQPMENDKKAQNGALPQVMLGPLYLKINLLYHVKVLRNNCYISKFAE